MTRSRSRGGTPARVEIRPWPGYSAQKNYAASTRVARLDPVARRRRARHAGPRRRRSRRCSRRSRRTAATACPASATTSDAGSAGPTGIRTTSCGSTTAAPPTGTAAACTSRCAVETASPGRLHARPAALSLSRHQPSSRDDRPLYDARGRADGAPTAASPSIAGVALHPPFAFLRNYILRGGFRERQRRLRRVGAELVLRLPEAGRRPRGAGSRPEPPSLATSDRPQ